MDDQTRREIAEEILALSSHYPSRKLAPVERKRWVEDYVTDLGARFNGSDVRVGCAIWRGAQNTKMPTPGELLAICMKLTTPLAVLPPPKAEPVYSEEHKREMQRKLYELAAEIAEKSSLRKLLMKRRPGETDVDYGRRVWPEREVRR